MRILLAEDEMDLSDAITKVLKYCKYDVTQVYDGLQASKACQENTYDAIILDVMMPKKNGFDVVKDLRKTGDTTPVLEPFAI